MRSFARSALLLALLIAEGLTLGVCFDSESIDHLPRGWWTPVLAGSGWLMTAALTVLTALVLIVSARQRREGADAERVPRRASLRVVLHLVCFAALFALSTRLFAADPPLERPGLIVFAWLGAAALTLATWLAALLPVRYLLAELRAHTVLLGLAFVLGACAFGVGKLSQSMWQPLRDATFKVVGTLLSACVSEVYVDPATHTLGAGDFAVTIAPDCSGYEGIGLAWVFLLAALWLFRDRLRFPRAYLLLAIGTLAAFVVNAVRLVALILVGAYVSPTIAIGGFHSYAGTLLFCATVLAIVAYALRSPWFAHVEERDELAPATYPAAPYLAPFLAFVAAGLCARAVAAEGTDPLFFLPPLAGLAACAWFARDYRRMSWRCSWFAVPAGVLAAGVWAAADALLRDTAAEAAPAALPLAVRIAGTLAIVPFVEELAFRGFLARRVSDADFERVAPERISLAGVLVSALAFGLLHRLVVAGVLAGIVYALVYRRRGRLADAVVAHATTNAVLVIAALATDRWELWM